MADEEAGEAKPKKKSAAMMTIVGIAILTLLGAGGAGPWAR